MRVSVSKSILPDPLDSPAFSSSRTNQNHFSYPSEISQPCFEKYRC